MIETLKLINSISRTKMATDRSSSNGRTANGQPADLTATDGKVRRQERNVPALQKKTFFLPFRDIYIFFLPFQRAKKQKLRHVGKRKITSFDTMLRVPSTDIIGRYVCRDTKAIFTRHETALADFHSAPRNVYENPVQAGSGDWRQLL